MRPGNGNGEHGSNHEPVNEINVLDYVSVLVRHRWMILRNVAIVTALTVLIALIWPRSFY
jgi:uncharacterized protein involved in exopolysaccharide biosynthesis